jgi:hypothetical protein
LSNYETNRTINVDHIAQAYWLTQNTDLDCSYKITEMTPTGNMEVSEMLERKIQWKTVDDAKLTSKISRGTDFSNQVLEAQRIRVYNI